MERVTSQLEARALFGINFIGVDELLVINNNFPLELPSVIPDIKIPKDVLIMSKDTHILILCLKRFNKQDLNIFNLREFFGLKTQFNKPNFYNQDWYLKEDFTIKTLDIGWKLIKKDIIDDSKGVLPDLLIKSISFPSAILCTYTFFAYYLCKNIILWEHNFIWCQDLDHNGDRIYVGKYTDLDRLNNSGFSIHRHLKIRKIYGAISCL